MLMFRINQSERGPGGDGLQVLAPTPELLSSANDSEDFNDCSYVVLYWTTGGKVLFAGDAHDATWEHVISAHEETIVDVDLLMAPHHGRKSGRSYAFLDVVRPKLTFFGNARAEHLAYDAWNYRELPYITNNQANCMVVDAGTSPMKVFVTNETFARKRNSLTYFNETHKAWFLQNIL